MRDSELPTVITIGETMVLVTPVEAESLETANLFHLGVGGAESNVASHLAALGHSVAWVGQVGNDALGRRVSRQVAEHRVDTRWVRINDTAPTGVYFKDPGRGVLYFRRYSAASEMGPASVADVPLEQAAIVHLSGITPALSPSCAALIDSVLERVGRGAGTGAGAGAGAGAGTGTGSGAGLVSFDVNFRPGLWDVAEAAPTLLAIANRSDIVFVGLDEAQSLWGVTSAADVRALIRSPRILVVKDGDVGATEFSADTAVFVPAITTAVVEVVGAGDAFAAGYLSAFLQGDVAETRLRIGHERAVLVLQSTRDVPLAAQ
jgi:2-dehydro-3-deoxygluconokinase